MTFDISQKFLGPVHLHPKTDKWDYLLSSIMKKKSFLVLTSGKFLETLGSGIGTGSIFCLSFSLSNRVPVLRIWIPNFSINFKYIIRIIVLVKTKIQKNVFICNFVKIHTKELWSGQHILWTAFIILLTGSNNLFWNYEFKCS